MTLRHTLLCFRFPRSLGYSYKVSAWVKTEGVTGTDTGATICVEWGGARGYIGGAYPAGVKGTQSWTLVSGMFVVPADATSVTIDVYVRKGMIGTVRRPFLFFLFFYSVALH